MELLLRELSEVKSAWREVYIKKGVPLSCLNLPQALGSAAFLPWILCYVSTTLWLPMIVPDELLPIPLSGTALQAQVELAVRRQMDNEVGPDQLVVVLDAQGASALQVTRKAQLCKDTAVTLNKVLPSLPLAQTSQGLPQTSSHFLEQGSPFECFPSALAA